MKTVKTYAGEVQMSEERAKHYAEWQEAVNELDRLNFPSTDPIRWQQMIEKRDQAFQNFCAAK